VTELARNSLHARSILLKRFRLLLYYGLQSKRCNNSESILYKIERFGIRNGYELIVEANTTVFFTTKEPPFSALQWNLIPQKHYLA
jgi:hypothetical protein